jgi:pyruvate dehydrogenase E2 component (dihydrolipoamide acetyltransferase)
VRDVDRKDLVALAVEVEALAARAKAGALRLEEITGGVIALSNLGMYPLDWFEAVVFPGQSAILAVGAVSSCVVAVDDRVEVRPMVTVTVAADHRLINGRVAAEYLAKVKEVIESGAFA